MLKKFEFWSNGKKVALEILEKVTENKVKVNVTINGNQIANETEASICKINNMPGKLFLQINDNFLCICDTKKAGSVEKNREIADWLWENIQNKDTYANTYGFTTKHWQNWEE